MKKQGYQLSLSPYEVIIMQNKGNEINLRKSVPVEPSPLFFFSSQNLN